MLEKDSGIVKKDIENGINDIVENAKCKLEEVSNKKWKNTEKIIIEIHKNNKISISELKEITGLSERTVARYLKKLKEKKSLIEMALIMGVLGLYYSILVENIIMINDYFLCGQFIEA